MDGKIHELLNGCLPKSSLSLPNTHHQRATREIYGNTHQESGMRKFAAAAMFHAFANDDNIREAVDRYEKVVL